jgi:hypothetical protein
MGSYAHLLTGSLVVLSTKNGVDPFVVSLFRESDKQKIEADQDYEDPRKRTGGDLLLSFSRDYYPGDEEYEDEGALHPPYWCYFIYAREARDRLELMGFTRSKAIGVYEECIAEYRKRIEGRYQYLVLPQEKYEREMSLLKDATFEKWTEQVKKAISGPSYVSLDAGTDELPPWVWEVWENTDIRFLLRGIIECCNDETPVIQDITRLIEGGWYKDTDELYTLAYTTLVMDYRTQGPIVVLTEGSTDQQVLSSALQLLYPHLSESFSFMDFATSNAAGGASVLVSTVRSFAGAGITNRVVALFDNDTAARDAIRVLAQTQLPENIKVMRYPYLELAASYPTLGPTGLVSMDVNELACSVELFFGRDVLQREDGTLSPIQWRGYVTALKQYQGEVLGKTDLQRRFLDKVARSREDSAYFAAADWSGMELIFSMLRKSFHD